MKAEVKRVKEYWNIGMEKWNIGKVEKWNGVGRGRGKELEGHQ